MADAPDNRGPEHRQHRRFPVDWRVTLRVPSWGVESHVAAHNASRGGLFVLTSRPPPAGATVELEIELPDGARAVLTGTVQHVITPDRAVASGMSPGIGVRVDDRYASDLVLLEEMASAAEPPRPPPVAVPLSDEAVPRPSFVGRVHVVGVAAARVVGLDLGASYSRVACAVGDRVILAVDEQGRAAVPSIVFYPAGGAPIAGWAGRDRLASEPGRTVTSVKRLLGRRLEQAAADVLPSLAYRVVAVGGGMAVDLDGQPRAVVDVAADLLAHVREVGEQSLHRPIEAAVLSCPAGASETQRQALREAARLAGLETADLVEEPMAAARAVGFGEQGDELAGVYDFGGGRFNFTVLETAGRAARVLLTEEDPHVGGETLDAALGDLVADGFWRETRIELRRSATAWRRLLLACEAVRRELSTESSAVLLVPGIAAIAGEPVDVCYRIQAAAFDEAVRALCSRSLTLCARALERLGLAPDRLARVLPVGGVAHVPAIRRALEGFFGRPLELPLAPDEAVVSGLARAGATRSA